MHADTLSNRLVEKDRYFREFSIWPVYARFNTEGWLDNFLSEEKAMAERLLSNFSYFNEGMTDALLRAAIQNYLRWEKNRGRIEWNGLDAYLNDTAFVLCEGENPHPADSGNLFARKLRDRLGIAESHIMRPTQALKRRKEFIRLVLVDDFCGTGNQLLETWTKTRRIGWKCCSFEELAQSGSHSFAYCCCVSTQKARDRIDDCFPALKFFAAHFVDERHSAVVVSSDLWSSGEVASALRIVRNASARAGYIAEDGSQDDWRGFHALGLSLAFNHGIPDACLPIFYSRRNNWTPLIPRTS